MTHFALKPFRKKYELFTMFFLLIASVITLSDCKKNSDKSTTEKLMNKWTLVQAVDTVYTSNAAPQVIPYTANASDYMDFRTNGSLYSFVNNVYDTTGYTYSEAKLTLDVKQHHYNIVTLTDQSMILYEPHYTTATIGYTASKITLKR